MKAIRRTYITGNARLHGTSFYTLQLSVESDARLWRFRWGVVVALTGRAG